MAIPTELQRPAALTPLRAAVEAIRERIAKLHEAHSQRMADLESKINEHRKTQVEEMAKHHEAVHDLGKQLEEAKGLAEADEALAEEKAQAAQGFAKVNEGGTGG